MRKKLNLLDTSDVGDLTITDCVSAGAVLHDRPLIVNGGGRHSKRLEEPLRQKVSVTLTAGFLNDHAKQKITDIAVLEICSGRETYRIFCRRLKQFLGCIIHLPRQRSEAIIHTGQSRSVS